MIEDRHIRKFAAVYAEAVLTFIETGEAQWLTWDGESLDFDFLSVDLDEKPRNPVMMFVDASWPQVLGDISEITDPDHPDFDAEALRRAVEFHICDEGYGERLLKGFRERLAKIRAGQVEKDDDYGIDGEDEE